MASNSRVSRSEFGPRRGAGLERRGLCFAKQRVLSGGFLRRLTIGDRQHRLDRCKGRSAIALEAIEGAGRRQALERLLVDGAGIEPRRYVA